MKDWKCPKDNTNEVWNTHTSSDHLLVTFLNPKWKSLHSRKILSKLVLFDTLFPSMKKKRKNEKSENLFVTGRYQDLWRSRVDLVDNLDDSLPLFEKRFSFWKNFKSNYFDGGATTKVGFHRVCQIRVQKNEIINIWWWNTFDKFFL